MVSVHSKHVATAFKSAFCILKPCFIYLLILFFEVMKSGRVYSQPSSLLFVKDILSLYSSVSDWFTMVHFIMVNTVGFSFYHCVC